MYKILSRVTAHQQFFMDGLQRKWKICCPTSRKSCGRCLGPKTTCKEYFLNRRVTPAPTATSAPIPTSSLHIFKTHAKTLKYRHFIHRRIKFANICGYLKLFILCRVSEQDNTSVVTSLLLVWSPLILHVMTCLQQVTHLYLVTLLFSFGKTRSQKFQQNLGRVFKGDK